MRWYKIGFFENHTWSDWPSWPHQPEVQRRPSPGVATPGIWPGKWLQVSISQDDHSFCRSCAPLVQAGSNGYRWTDAGIQPSCQKSSAPSRPRPHLRRCRCCQPPLRRPANNWVLPTVPPWRVARALLHSHLSLPLHPRPATIRRHRLTGPTTPVCVHFNKTISICIYVENYLYCTYIWDIR